jgi:Rieske Fe-S protein
MKHPLLSRRKFCLGSAQATIALAITGIPLRGSSAAGHEVAIDLSQGANSPLTTIGGAMYVTMPSTNTNVIVVRNSETEVSAFSSVCTHHGCKVGLPVAGAATCPCHGARFSDTGAVLRGPATSDLKKFYAVIEGNTIYVDSTPTGIDGSPKKNRKSKLPPAIYFNTQNSSITVTGKSGAIDHPVSLSLFDMQGRILGEFSWNGIGSYTIPAGHLTKGSYLLKIKTAATGTSVQPVQIY